MRCKTPKRKDQYHRLHNTKTTTENIFNVLNGATLEQRSPTRKQKPFDVTILKKQIIGSCHKYGIKDCSEYIKIIEYYYHVYMQTFHKEHPHLSSSAMNGVIEALQCGSENVDDVNFETYQYLINQHFKTQYSNCDYNICHFMTEGIRNNRFFEACY